MQDLCENKSVRQNIFQRIFNKIKFLYFANHEFKALREHAFAEIKTLREETKTLREETETLRKETDSEISGLRQGININALKLILDEKIQHQNETQNKFNQIFEILHCRPPHLSNPFLIQEECSQIMGFDNNLTQYRFNYVEFENEFRGSEDLIKERQRCYLPFFENKHTLLDIGSGRGEFLELASQHNFNATGIEINQDMIHYCQQKGISNVICSDGNSFLRQLSVDQKIDGIFSAQVIEHLEFDYLLEFLQLSYKALNENGVFIAETINPHCHQAVKLFYLDLSHVKPIFPETILLLLRSIGFSKAKIFFPYVNSFSDEHIFSQGDYAVVAWK